ncbi:radical SAM protein [Niabella ginsengisoli]|uniref:Radical SAM protein n=1 Tax=Niabella ginsengisoli TaxID=522298 RepID=A0ABS9SJL3_9BACT|nr:radical SAM protein [Niabella ginsengisoli]MCH5598491.1 radical SAM protein [Niabella ginsengisoli]
MSGVYIHIPFCKQACNYCNFHFATSLAKKQVVLDAINKEIFLTASGNSEPINTIYFGGGTPSLLSVSEISTILKTIRSFYTINTNAEITLEANPDDISVEKLESWKAAGINRLSMGVQSFLKKI